MANLEHFIELGRSLKIPEEELHQFATLQLQQLREERTTLRQIAKEQVQIDKEKAQMAKENDERQAQIAKEQAQIAKENDERQAQIAKEQAQIAKENDERQARMAKEAHELEMAKMKETLAADERRNQLAKEALEIEERRSQIALAERAIMQERLAMEKEEKERMFTLRNKELYNAAALQKQKYEAERQLKHDEFINQLETAKIQKQTAIELKELEINRPTPGTGTQGKHYIPRLPPLTPQDSLPIFLGRFVDSMKAAELPESQWITRLRDILTGKVLKTFQELSPLDKSSFNTVRDKLLASQNLIAEHYRREFLKMTPDPNQSFS